MAVFSLGSSSSENEQASGQQAAASKAAAIQGLGSAVTVIQPEDAKIQARLLTSIDGNIQRIMVTSASSMDAANLIHDEIVALRSDLKEKSFMFQLNSSQFKEVMKHQEEQANDLKKVGPAIKTFDRIAKLILDKTWDTKAQAFLKAAEVVAKGFEVIAKGINQINAKPIISLAVGIATLGLAIWAFGEIVTAGAIVETMVTLAALGLLFRFLFSKEMTNGLLKFGASIAITGLAIWAFSELVNLETVTPVVLALVGLAGALWLFNKIGDAKSTSLSLILAAAGIFALGYAIRSFDGVTMEQALISAAAVGGLGIALRLFSPQSFVGAAALAFGAIGLGLLGLGLRAFPDDTVDKILPILGFVVGYGAALAVAGAVAPLIIVGSAAMVTAGAALFVMAGGLALISATNIDQTKIEQFSNGLIAVGAAFRELGGPIATPLILLGAATAVGIGAATILSATGLALVSALTIDATRIQAFGDAVMSLGDAYSDIGGPVRTPLILLGVAAVVPMSLATVIAAGALGLVSVFQPMKQTAVDAYKYALTKLADTYVDIGGPIRNIKIGFGVVAALMISSATAALAESVHKIDKYEVTPDKAQAAASIVDNFITSIADTLDRNKERLDSVREGIYAVNGLGSLMVGLADGVGKMANLNYVQYEVRDGKLVPVNVVKLKEDDFGRVGLGIGKMVNALTEPLALIGGKQESFSIFGLKVTNPFSNKVKAGIEALQGIGNILNPISETIKVYADKGIDTASAIGFAKILGIVLNGIGQHADALVQRKFYVDSDKSEKMFDSLGTFFKSTAGIDIKKIEDFAKGMDRISGKMSNFKSDFNALDLQKLTVFAEISKSLATVDSNNKLLEVIRELGSIAESIAALATAVDAQRASNTSNSYNQWINPGQQPQAKATPTPFINQPANGDTAIVDMSKDLSDRLDRILTALRAPLTVRPDETSWRQLFMTRPA